MMNRLYVFAIGGSGERVLKSLAMVLAAGTPIEANEVVPVIVDNDANSAALKDCERILTAYGNTEGDNGVRTLYERAFGKDAGEWPSFCKTIIRKPILLNVAGDAIGNLKGIIACPSESNRPEEKDNNVFIRSISIERDLLFTHEDQTMPLTVGFVGNPNIGSVVLKSLSFTDPQFTSIYSEIHSNDGVIVIGSLFGGTGAAGFPLIVNTFNQITDPTKKPVLGGVAVLPYFDTNKAQVSADEVSIDKDKYDVNSETFATKTRAALMYYDDYMMGVDFMYYVGDDKRRVYPHAVGGKAQRNNVNLVELLSAMSIVDFAKQDHSEGTVYKQPVWGFSDNGTASNVSGITNYDIRRAFVKFKMLEEILKNGEFLKKAISELNSKFVSELHFTEEVRMSTFTDDVIKYKPATGLNHLLKEWDSWMGDLSAVGAVRKLRIFNDEVKTVDNNFTSNFLADSGYGIAKTVTRKEGIFSRREVIDALKPAILDTMLEVYDKNLTESMKKNVAEYQILPYELLVISKALDRVIDEKCTI